MEMLNFKMHTLTSNIHLKVKMSIVNYIYLPNVFKFSVVWVSALSTNA